MVPLGMLEFNQWFFSCRRRIQGYYTYSIPFLAGFLILAFLLTGCNSSILDVSARGDVVALEVILSENPESIYSKNDLGKSAIHYAASHNRLDSFKVLLAHNVEVNDQDGTGLTALHIAAVGDHYHIVRALIRAGADVGIRDDFGDTPLHSAALHGSQRALKELLKTEVGLELRNHDGLTPLELAKRFSRDEIVGVLEQSFMEKSGKISVEN